MRVIGGLYRSRLLTAPKGTTTRPTSDRLRETLFNVLAPHFPGCRFVDLYAGTGAVGIEALSRGASHAWFAENAPPAQKALRANLANLGITRNVTVEDRGTGALLDQLTKLQKAVDIIFLDPPYELEQAYTATLTFLGSARGQTCLAPGAIVIAEHSSKIPLPGHFGSLQKTRSLKQSDASLSFFEAPRADPLPPTALIPG